jgi:diguanylate cyclase (GGDEF)-like protein
MDSEGEPENVAIAGLPDVDPLTKLPTRHQFFSALARLFEQNPSASPTLILIDLDRFKAANHGFGHGVGDVLLCRVAQRLLGLTKGATMLARVSGDGFGVLLEDGAGALRMAERVLELIGQPYAVSGHSITLGASVGLALAPQDGTDAAALFHSADLALHQAEQDGGSRLRRFEPGMQTRAFHRRFLEGELRTALAKRQVELRRALVSEQFEVHYQPQVNLADRRVTGFEALLRWRHPTRGMISPAEFIPIAEEIGLIGLLGDWVLRVACRDAAQWPVPRGASPLRVAVNVSPLQLREGKALLHAIRTALEEAQLPPERLEIELTETALASDAGDVLSTVKSTGCSLALDDFGTGYSSLGRLRDMPFDRIKIDRSFMRDLEESVSEQSRRGALWMIRAIASLGTGLGLTTIAEGIETERQATLAFDAGCTEMQGFLISRAMPAHTVADFIVSS